MPKRSDISDEEIIAACDAFHSGTAATPEQALADRYPPKVILAKMAQMVDRRILEYGVSLRTAWVDRPVPPPVLGPRMPTMTRDQFLGIIRGFGK